MDTQKFESSFASAQDTMSLWEVAHRWLDLHPSQTDLAALPFVLTDLLIAMMQGQVRSELGVVRTRRGNVMKDWRYILNWSNYAPQEGQAWDGSEDHRRELWHDYMSEVVRPHDEVIERHEPMMDGGEPFDREYLDSIYVDQYDLGGWAIEYGFPFPKFWFSDDEKKDVLENIRRKKAISARFEGDEEVDQLIDQQLLQEFEGSEHEELARAIYTPGKIQRQDIDLFWEKLTAMQRSRLMCREVAKVLWAEGPDSSITQIEHHNFILEYCGGAKYTGKDTMRNWIKDLDPRPPEKKRGRPAGKTPK